MALGRLSGPALASLACLTLNFCLLSIFMTRLKPGEARYKASSAVVLTEIGKLVVSVVLALREIEHAHAMSTPPSSSPNVGHSHVDVNEPAQHGLGITDPAASTQRPLYDPPPDRLSMDEPGPVDKSKLAFAGMADVPTPVDSPTQRRLRGQSMGGSRAQGAHGRSSSISLASRGGVPAFAEPSAPGMELVGSNGSAESWQPSPAPESRDLVFQLRRLYGEVTSGDYWKLAVPALCFSFQNVAQYTAIANLSVPAYQVTSQLKILTTALCAVVMLGRKLSLQQWAALTALAAGVAVVQLSATSEDSHHHAHGADDGPVLRPWLGFSAVLASSLSSGFASTYFEKMLKASAPAANGTPAEERTATAAPTGLWVRNVQLSTFALAIGFGMNAIEANADAVFGRWSGTAADAALQSATESMASTHPSSPLGALANFLEGFDRPIVWLVIALQIFGGVLAALVIKYADNILKVFATSLSIVLSFALSVALFSFDLTLGSLAGAALVVGSTFAFAAPARRPSPPRLPVPRAS